MPRTKSRRAPAPSKTKSKLRKAPLSAHREWSDEETEALKLMIRQNTPTRVIGLKLNKSVGSVKYHVRKEGLSLKPTNQSPFG